MALSRRQFFRRFWNHNERTEQERRLRYDALESYVRTNLLPYDFGLTEAQYNELLEEVHKKMQSATDEELFASGFRQVLDILVDTKLQPWREAYWLDPQNADTQNT